MPQVAILNYGVGNLRSVKRGLEKSGAEVQIVHSAKNLDESDAIILPGVGAYATAIKNITSLSDILKRWVDIGNPVLGICLGLQLFFTRSTEGGSIEGLNLIPGDVVNLPARVKSPHMGWNTINIVRFHSLLEGVHDKSYFYFAHSYIPQPLEQEVVAAITDYGVTFPSVVIKQNMFATQFHPEKSGKVGSTILRNFVKITKR